jgi:hypothetical protein
MLECRAGMSHDEQVRPVLNRQRRMTTDPGKTTLSTRQLASIVAVAAVALSVVAIAPAISARASSSAAQPVFFVPLGEFPRSEAAALARYVERELAVQTGVLSRSAKPKTA